MTQTFQVKGKQLLSFLNNTCADQPAQPRSLISACVIRFLGSVILSIPTFKYLLVSVVEQLRRVLRIRDIFLMARLVIKNLSKRANY